MAGENRKHQTGAISGERRQVTALFYDIVGSSTRLGLVDLLACFALFDDDPSRINQIEAEFAKVTPELVRATAQEYLRRDNRTVLTLLPGKTSEPHGAAQ